MALSDYEWGKQDALAGQVEFAWRDQWSDEYARGVQDGVAARISA